MDTRNRIHNPLKSGFAKLTVILVAYSHYPTNFENCTMNILYRLKTMVGNLIDTEELFIEVWRFSENALIDHLRMG
jgi:hypothetical protein